MATASSSDFNLLGPDGTERNPPPTATLSCRLSPEVSAVDMEIRWFKETDCICLYKNREVIKGSGYEDRVSLFTQELERGNVSLQLKDYELADRGDYLCQVISEGRTEELSIYVGGIQVGNVCKMSVFIEESSKEWTEDERMKMKESVLRVSGGTSSESLRRRNSMERSRQTMSGEESASLAQDPKSSS